MREKKGQPSLKKKKNSMNGHFSARGIRPFNLSSAFVLSEEVRASVFKGKVNSRVPSGVKARQEAKKVTNSRRTEKQEER